MRGIATGLVAALALIVAGGGCGDDDEASGSGSKAPVTVSAAASLKRAFTTYGERADGVTARFSFAGSDELAAQIRQGVKPDVFAAANTKLPDQLFKEGLVEKPVVFAGNRLVLAVPAQDPKVAGLDDLTTSGVTIAIGAEGVPIGSYTRDVLARLGEARSKAILKRVRSNEPDVAGIVGKLTQGAADAGFVYVTDVAAAGGKLRAIELPATLQPSVRYGAAVVKGAPHREAAQRFLDGLLEGEGARALKEAGFEPPSP